MWCMLSIPCVRSVYVVYVNCTWYMFYIRSTYVAYVHLLSIIYVMYVQYYSVLAGLPGFARDSCSKIISISAFYYYNFFFL